MQHPKYIPIEDAADKKAGQYLLNRFLVISQHRCRLLGDLSDNAIAGLIKQCWLGLCRRVEGAADKAAIMQQLIKQMQDKASDQQRKQHAQQLAVYIGDSPSDVGAMLQADLGIVVGQNVRLRQVAQAYGVKINPLTAGTPNMLCLYIYVFIAFAGPTVNPRTVIHTCAHMWQIVHDMLLVHSTDTATMLQWYAFKQCALI